MIVLTCIKAKEGCGTMFYPCQYCYVTKLTPNVHKEDRSLGLTSLTSPGADRLGLELPIR